MLTKIKSLCNTWHFYAILVLLASLTLISLYYGVLLIIYLIYLYKIKLLKLSFIFLLLYYVISILGLSLYSFKLEDEISGIVISVKSYSDYQNVVILKGFYKVYLTINDNNEIHIGQRIIASGWSKEIDLQSFGTYLRSIGIYRKYSVSNYKVSNEFNLYSIKYKIFNFYENKLDEKSYSYLMSLIFGLNDFDLSFKEQINNLGISYLFCISGFHINMIIILFDYILSKFIHKQHIKDFIVIILLLIYAFITGFSYGVLRATLMVIITKISYYKSLSLTKLDCLSLSLIVISFINPYALYNTSFRLSFLSVFIIILITNNLKSENKLISNYYITVILFLASAPIVISINNEINLLTIFISPIILILFSYIIIPFTYILLIFPQIYPLINSIYIIFESIIESLNNIDILLIGSKKFSPILYILYYFLFYNLLCHYERYGLKYFNSILFIIIIYIFNVTIYLIPYDRITILDVGQGDSILIECANNKGNILIDSYNNIDKLEEKGIKNINTLIITHSDNDHSETALEVINNYNVNTLILSYYDEYDFLNDIKTDIKILNYKADDVYYFNNLKFNFLSPYIDYSSSNNNSLVFILSINSFKMLFTADIEEKAEKDIIDKYGTLKFDILKVAHHGSLSSTSLYFLNNIKFSDAIISVGKNNYYNHPNDKVIESLNSKNIYRTDNDNDIYIHVYNDKYKIKTNIYHNLLIYSRKRIKLNV